MGILQVLEDENKQYEDDRGHSPGDSFHDSFTRCWEEDVDEETWESVEAELNEEHMETNESSLDIFCGRDGHLDVDETNV